MTFWSDARQPEVSLFSLLICLKTSKFVLLSFFYSYRDDLSKHLFKTAKRSLAVDVCRSKASLLKILIIPYATCMPKALGRS